MRAHVAAARIANAKFLNQSGIVHPALSQILNAFRIAVQVHLIKSGGVLEELRAGRPLQWCRCRYSSRGMRCLSRSKSSPMVATVLPASGYEPRALDPRQGWWVREENLRFKGAGAKARRLAESKTRWAKINVTSRERVVPREPAIALWL